MGCRRFHFPSAHGKQNDPRNRMSLPVWHTTLTAKKKYKTQTLRTTLRKKKHIWNAFFSSVLFRMSFHKISISVTGRANRFALYSNKTNAFLFYSGIYFSGRKNESRSDLEKVFSRPFQMDNEIQSSLQRRRTFFGFGLQEASLSIIIGKDPIT